MNTLESEFRVWLHAQGIDNELSVSDLRDAFNAGYMAGFDHAKKSALSTLATALDPRPSHD